MAKKLNELQKAKTKALKVSKYKKEDPRFKEALDTADAYHNRMKKTGRSLDLKPIKELQKKAKKITKQVK